MARRGDDESCCATLGDALTRVRCSRDLPGQGEEWEEPQPPVAILSLRAAGSGGGDVPDVTAVFVDRAIAREGAERL